LQNPLGLACRGDRLPMTLATLLLALLTACGGTSTGLAGAGSLSAGASSVATAAVTNSVVATASAAPVTTSATASTTTASLSTASRTASAAVTAVTTAQIAAALSAASRLATSTATGSAGGGPVAQKLVFTGVVAGTVTSSPAPKLCGKQDTDILGATHHVLGFGTVDAKIGDANYAMSLQVDPYKGPGTYGVGPNGDTTALVFLNKVNKDGNQTQYISTNSAVVVVAPDEASGTVEADFEGILDNTAKGHVSGSWRCR